MRHITLANLYADLDARLDALRDDRACIDPSRAVVERALGDGKAYYGINTGFGVLANQRISDAQVAELQRNLILSHAVGVGDPLSRELSALMLKLKIHALAQGYSGVSRTTFERLLWHDKRGLTPFIPSRGSVGASGDLAPLAHLALPLLGQGKVWLAGEPEAVPTGEALRRHHTEPIELQAKDGLAMINGTQLMSAHGALVLHRALHLVKLADVIAAMSLEALQGSVTPFDQRIADLRPHPGHAAVSHNIRELLIDSEILESHRDCGKVQDPYSLRCVPQVHGASRDALAHANHVVETEINSVTDNPLVFEDGSIVSGGNFHGQPLALVIDYAAIALAELASISERRCYLLLGGHDGLPRLLMKETGVNSGFMIPQYTAAALVSENKVLCHPASVDSIPTCLGQEDHVSMGSIGALKLMQVLKNVEHVLAIEMMTAAQALDYRLPLKAGRGVVIAHEYIRSRIPHREADGVFRDDLEGALSLVQTPAVIDTLTAAGTELR
ncbi:MAG: histidine ammonia-lyase [Phycisphaerales bacterium JB063]